MIEIAPAIINSLVLIIMTGTLFLILIPSVPVSALEWTIAILFGALTGFERLTLWAALIITLLMLMGSTSGLWLPFFGLKGRQISCMGMVAMFVGMAIGSGIMPFIGTLIGGVIGVMFVEYVRGADVDDAFDTGKSTLVIMLMGMAAEFVFASAIVFTTLVSIVMTG